MLHPLGFWYFIMQNRYFAWCLVSFGHSRRKLREIQLESTFLCVVSSQGDFLHSLWRHIEYLGDWECTCRWSNVGSKAVFLQFSLSSCGESLGGPGTGSKSRRSKFKVVSRLGSKINKVILERSKCLSEFCWKIAKKEVTTIKSQHKRQGKARKEKIEKRKVQEDCLARRWRHYVDSKKHAPNLSPFWHATRLGASR